MAGKGKTGKGKPKKPKHGSKSKPQPEGLQSTIDAVNQSQNDQNSIDLSANSQPVGGSHEISDSKRTNMSQMQDTNSTICEACKVYIEESWLVRCEDCEKWFHYDCGNYPADAKEEDPWFCLTCSKRREKEVLESEKMSSEDVWSAKHGVSQLSEIEPAKDNISQEYNSDRREETREVNLQVSNQFSQLNAHPIPIRKSGLSGFMGCPIYFKPQQESVSERRFEVNVESFLKWKAMKNPLIPLNNPVLLLSGNNKPPNDIQPNLQKSNLVEPSHQNPLVKDDTIIPISSSTKTQRTTITDRTQLDQEVTIPKENRSARVPSTNRSVSSRTSSRTTMSSQQRVQLEQQRIREELQLQAKLDEEKIALKLEALALKESREKKFLEEKFKAMQEEDIDDSSSDGGSKASGFSKHSRLSKVGNQTGKVLAWIENDRRQKSQRTKGLQELSITIGDEEMAKLMQCNWEDNSDMKRTQDGKQQAKNAQQNPSENYSQQSYTEYSLPEDRNPTEPQFNQQNMRPNSTLIQNDQMEPPQNNHRVRFIPPQHNQHQDGRNSNKRYQSNAYVVIGDQENETPPMNDVYHSEQNYQQKTVKTTASQLDQDGRSMHQQHQGHSNPQPKLSSSSSSKPGQDYVNNQQNVPPLDQQHSRYTSSQSQTHQSHQYTSSQFDQGPNNDHGRTSQARGYDQERNANVPGSGMQPGSQSLSSSYRFRSQRPTLTTNQIAARHVVNKKLPFFDGYPGDWPEFIQQFINTTEACGFDNTENLGRLSESLTGTARTIVKAQLMFPVCVPSIIATLEQKFGRKEMVVKAVLEEIRREPQIKPDKLEALSNYGYKVHNVCQTIIGQEMQFYLYDPELVQELVDKLPHQTKIDWARYTAAVPEITLATLSEWLITLSRSLNRITMPEIKSAFSDRKNDRRSDSSRGKYLNAHGTNKVTNNDQSRSKCQYCSKGCKNLAECYKFKRISVDERWKFLYEHKKICRGCLKNHGRKCTTPKECGINKCSYRHHPMLHDNERLLKNNHNKSSGQPTNKSSGQSTNEQNPSCNAHGGNQAILYKIIPVILKNGNRTVSTFAYMDDGSGLTLVESDLADALDLRGTPQKLCLRWTSGTVRHERDSMRVVLGISGEGENQQTYQMRDVRTVKSLDLPSQHIDKRSLIEKYPYLARIPFQDFEAAPRILIGLDNVKLGLAREYVEGKWSEPIATQTLLGWVVHGPNGSRSSDDIHHTQYHFLSINQCLCQADRDDELHQQIEEFFSLENFGVRALTSSVESKDVQRAIHIMEKTTIRKNNRFETGLLWKFDEVNLPNNYKMALKRLECQDKRMQANPELMENINNQIQNFIQKGYARKLTPEEINVNDPRIWYLPVFHHLDPKKPEKVRLVWDAAAKYKGVSLNSMLLSGPDNLVALIDILRRFREKLIAIGGDIEEMYHQVKVIQKDRNSQRFLWRNGNLDAKPDVYIMDVLTFGTSCSPSLAQNVKNKNASEFEIQYPQAAKAIKENHYVDDWLESQHTVEDAIRMAKEVKYIHQQGGFNLRKFISNSAEVLEALGEDNSKISKDLNVTTTLTTQRVLGMWWDAETDCFTYSLKYTKLNEEVLLGLRAPTKRELLKTLMSIFDPLGLIGFYLVYLKILLQEVWKAKIAWDEQLPEGLNERWKKWIKFLPLVEKVRIPRLYSSKISPGTAQSIELHSFVDASENAYCATCFLRIIDEKGVVCVLVGAKTKVASIKPLLTIPRLELLAAVLGARLAKSIQGSLTLKINKRYFWSDSRDVLCWIRSTTRKYRQFVAFRVGEILESTMEREWRWVPGKLNVADDGTKWLKSPNFDKDCRWFKGPEFLYGDESSWPGDLLATETTEEELHIHLAHTKIDPPSQIDPERFSNWSRLVKAQALSTRYIRKLVAKVKGQPLNGHLTTAELKEAEYTLYKLAQFDWFYDEIMTLKSLKEQFGKKSYVKKSSSIYKRSPYIENDGLLRVRGRIDKIRNVNFDTKRPIILPKQHKITELVINNFHRMYLHGNNNTVINEINQEFYIPRLRVVIKKVVKNCQVCKNKRAKPVMPEMGDLPIARLSPEFRIFTHTGVDYFGPMKVMVKRSAEKRWGVLFTCMTVRAIHIEIVPSLTADSCILAIRNFTNLRGTPAEFHSDNGTHFTAADKELKKEFEKLDKDKIQSHYTRSYTTWNFIPPASPHMAGAWERLIGVVKNNLEMVMFARTPKEELLRSYLYEIVNIVNSRPLTYLQLESSEDEALTPNHFIFGTSNGNKAPGEFPYEEKSLTKSWRRSQELTNKFWRRWIKEYLPTLTCRSKWFPKAKPIKVGDIVLLVDEQNERNCYPRGVVVEVLPDKYGQVRRATVKVTEVKTDVVGRTKDAPVRISIKTRPVAKLAVLEVGGNGEEVKPVGAPITKCPNGEENVTDGNSNIVTDIVPNPEDNHAKNDKQKSDKRKFTTNLRRSNRIAEKQLIIRSS